MNDVFGIGFNFAEAVGWNPTTGPYAGSINVETANNALADDGGFFGALGDIFSDVSGAVTQGYQALTAFELAKYQNQFAGNLSPTGALPPVASSAASSPSAGLGIDPRVFLVGGAALVAFLLLRK
tara:strand:+ start:100 stop:474 length:375 start_codon:yes stop_codon:yes gene_type:complete